MMKRLIFNSIFKKEFQDLIELKQSQGFKYTSECSAFLRLDKFFYENKITEKAITREIVEEWCRKTSYETVSNQVRRISILRVFCTYLNDMGIEAYIPPKGLVRKAPKYDAHIYTDKELKQFFKSVDQSKSVSISPYRHLVMPVFFRILYTSGLRVSELRLLKIKDFHLDKGYIIVRSGKNKKDRIVPVHPILVQKCIELKEIIHQKSEEDEYFFMITPGVPMKLHTVYRNFRRYLEKAGISHTGRGPRVHDFRHTYCVNLLKMWLEEGKNLLNYLPYMKTMLGHETFEETAYYLKLTQSLYPVLTGKLEEAYSEMIEVVIPDEKEFY